MVSILFDIAGDFLFKQFVVEIFTILSTIPYLVIIEVFVFAD